MLILQDAVMKKMCLHAQTEYPKECCGILLGRRKGKKRIACKVMQTGNIADEDQNTTHFSINPLEIVKAERSAERQNLEIVGFYHSHPDYEAAASKSDILHMIEGYSYPIISVKDGRCVKVKSFEKTVQTDTDAKEEVLVKERENADFGICISNIADFCKSKGED